MQNENGFNPYAGYSIIEERRLHGARKVIAKRLMESYQSKIHATMHRYIEIEKLKKFKKKIGKGSVIDHFARAVALSLIEKPELNATYDGEIYRIYKDVNISYAVSTPRGLVTPVLKNADKISLDDFCDNRKKIVSLVMEWKHKLADILGGTFTITNLGNFGVDFTLPIINPPQVAILGIARACKLNISWDNSEPPKIKELLPVSITYDHAIIDGVSTAEFAQVLQEKVNQPESLWDKV